MIFIKALSVHPVWADFIASGEKTVECRTRYTNYRGELLICATSKKVSDFVSGHAICTVNVTDCVPFTKSHLNSACFDNMPTKQSYAWILDNLKIIEPFPVSGQQFLFNVDKPIKYIDFIKSEDDLIDYWDGLGLL